MKLSIKSKLFFIMFSIVIGFLLSVLLVNGTVLEEYYLKKKQENLLTATERTTDIFETKLQGGQISQDQVGSIARLEDSLNCKVLIVCEPVSVGDGEGQTEYKSVYNSLLPYAIRDGETVEYLVTEPAEFIKEHVAEFSQDEAVVRLDKSEKLGGRMLAVYRVMDMGEQGRYYFCLRSSYSNINESIAIFNKFCLIMALFMLLIGGVIVYLIAHMVAKPIVSINRATARMRELDFTTRVTVDSTDEIGELGDNINILSDRLEATIKKLTEANKKLEEDLRMKEHIDEMRRSFISNVSHELKTPLSLIMGYAEALKYRDPDDRGDEYCDIIIDESQKMNALVGSILRLSQLESGLASPDRSDFSIVEMMKKSLKSYSLILEEQRVETRVNAAEDYRIYADYEMTAQVVNNYLSNAVHYVSGEKKQICVDIARSGDKIRVSVFNSGNHIPEDQIDLIWDNFYKVDKARTREYGGHGLGLSIVKNVMERHGNKYGVVNVEGGVCFFFEADEYDGGEDAEE